MDETDFNTEIKGVNRFTENARKVISNGYQIAQEHGYTNYFAIHLFWALLSDKSGIVNELFNRVGVDIDITIERISKEFDDYALTHLKLTESEKQPEFSKEIKDIINQSFVIASNLDHVYVGTEHLLLAMFKLTNVDFIEEMNKAGINYDVIEKTLMTVGNYPFAANQKNPDFESEKGSKSLPFFARNMNEISQDGGFMNITGRDKEIKRLIHILARKLKNNPILVGDAGVGKTAIVEGFVNLIVQKKVPASFLNKKVLGLDVSAILSGARLRGDVEERITAIINEAVEEGNVILFIDEIHTIVGAGSSGGRDSMDIANILKPYLTNSNLTVIGATTADEYSKYFETDTALSRRFQPIFVEELSVESAKKVLTDLKADFENYHSVKIKQEAVDTAVELSNKFIKDRYLPDKAIDLIDEAAASLKVGREIAMEPELSGLGNQLLSIQTKKEKALNSENFDQASELKIKEDEIIKQIEDVIEGRKKVSVSYSKVVNSDLIKDIIVEWTKIPIAASDISDKKLKDLESNLKKRIIGEDRVVENVSKAIQRSHLGLSGDSRPLASFLFLGPTGVGKTELAKMLAQELFGSSNLLLQINMSEYMEMHSVAKLIGAPPGYVGYQEGGQLTTFVKRKPYSVILFDEIEKAHPDTLNLLLQVLEEGELVDGKGNRVSLKNCIIVMTSNIGAEEVSADSRLGFNVDIDDIKKEEVDIAYEDMREQVLNELKMTLRPELINRIDVIDVFRGLNKDDCLLITQLQVRDLILNLIPKGIVLSVADKVIEKINNEGYSKEYGVRNIKRKIQEVVINELGQYLLHAKISRKRNKSLKIHVDLKNDKITFAKES